MKNRETERERKDTARVTLSLLLRLSLLFLLVVVPVAVPTSIFGNPIIALPALVPVSPFAFVLLTTPVDVLPGYNSIAAVGSLHETYTCPSDSAKSVPACPPPCLLCASSCAFSCLSHSEYRSMHASTKASRASLTHVGF